MKFIIIENGIEQTYHSENEKYFKNGLRIYKQDFENAQNTRYLLDNLFKKI